MGRGNSSYGRGNYDGRKEGLKNGRVEGAIWAVLVSAVIAFGKSLLSDKSSKKK